MQGRVLPIVACFFIVLFYRTIIAFLIWHFHCVLQLLCLSISVGLSFLSQFSRLARSSFYGTLIDYVVKKRVGAH